MSELAADDLEDHLSFIEQLLTRHEWEPKRRAQLTGQLGLIRAKQADTRLYLGVIGEFSSGKSTLINALIRDDLLKTDVLQATTASNTVIAHGDQLDVAVSFTDGGRMSFREKQPFWRKWMWRLFPPAPAKLKGRLRSYIAEVTANEAVARHVAQVHISHPSEALRNGLVIVDTPGTDADNSRHEEVTKQAIQGIADAAIVLVSALKPLSQHLLNFIGQQFDGHMGRCIFVITQMDLLRPKERERVLEFSRRKLQEQFRVNSVQVLPMAAPLILKKEVSAELYQQPIPEADEAVLQEQSFGTEAAIYRILREQRQLLQLQKLLQLLKDILTGLDRDLQQMEDAYRKRHEALMSNQIRDLSGFIGEQKLKHEQAVRQRAVAVQLDVHKTMEKIKQELVERVKSGIYGTSSGNQLNKYMKKQLDTIMNQTQTVLSQEIGVHFEQLRRICSKQIPVFEEEFKKLYLSLATLGGTITVNERWGAQASQGMMQSYREQVAGVREIGKEQDKKVRWAALGGGGSGALIGTILLPGVGTAVGFIVGSLAGLLFKKPLKELQEQYADQIEQAIEESFRVSLDEVDHSTNQQIDSMIRELNAVIHDYFKRYDSLVKEMIRRDEEEKQQLASANERISNDLNQLAIRHQLLEGTRRVLAG